MPPGDSALHAVRFVATVRGTVEEFDHTLFKRNLAITLGGVGSSFFAVELRVRAGSVRVETVITTEDIEIAASVLAKMRNYMRAPADLSRDLGMTIESIEALEIDLLQTRMPRLPPMPPHPQACSSTCQLERGLSTGIPWLFMMLLMLIGGFLCGYVYRRRQQPKQEPLEGVAGPARTGTSKRSHWWRWQPPSTLVPDGLFDRVPPIDATVDLIARLRNVHNEKALRMEADAIAMDEAQKMAEWKAKRISELVAALPTPKARRVSLSPRPPRAAVMAPSSTRVPMAESEVVLQAVPRHHGESSGRRATPGSPEIKLVERRLTSKRDNPRRGLASGQHQQVCDQNLQERTQLPGGRERTPTIGDAAPPARPVEIAPMMSPQALESTLHCIFSAQLAARARPMAPADEYGAMKSRPPPRLCRQLCFEDGLGGADTYSHRQVVTSFRAELSSRLAEINAVVREQQRDALPMVRLAGRQPMRQPRDQPKSGRAGRVRI